MLGAGGQSSGQNQRRLEWPQALLNAVAEIHMMNAI